MIVFQSAKSAKYEINSNCAMKARANQVLCAPVEIKYYPRGNSSASNYHRYLIKVGLTETDSNCPMDQLRLRFPLNMK